MLPRSSVRWGLISLLALSGAILETFWHSSHFRVQTPSRPLDETFQAGCAEPDTSMAQENATFVMLARNSDREGAVSAVQSIEKKFNRFFHYPMVFLNNQPFDAGFVESLTEMASGEVTFETFSSDYWSYPSWIDQDRARALMKEAEARKVRYAGEESYHHMCRFFSGMFFDVPALRRYRYFWRLEPDIQYTCMITYDPFRKMREANKVYGYTIALSELLETAPSLFRLVSQYKSRMGIASTDLWKSMVEPALLPQALRWLLGRLDQSRDAEGSRWNLCHFWSNFEIADLDFFRNAQYRDFFKTLDESGGFFYERWGDAPVHSLAAALFLKPEQIHWFEHLGYMHANFMHCEPNAAGNQLEASRILGDGLWQPTETLNGTGCRCECDPAMIYHNRPLCLHKLRTGVEFGTRPRID